MKFFISGLTTLIPAVILSWITGEWLAGISAGIIAFVLIAGLLGLISALMTHLVQLIPRAPR